MVVHCGHAISYGRCWRRAARPLGNWAAFTDQGDSQTREHDAANQTCEITGDLDWVDPDHDAAGNMILAPRPGQESCACEALLLVYDGWNRLAKGYEDTDGDGGEIDQGDTLIAEYQYDGNSGDTIPIFHNSSRHKDLQDAAGRRGRGCP